MTSPADYRYRLLVDGMVDYAITMLDAKGLVASWNAGAERLLGYAAPDILGRHLSVFHTWEDCRSGLAGRALEVAAREGRFECEGWNLRKDGSRFWAHGVIDPIRAPLGMLMGFAMVTRDLTERRRADIDLNRGHEIFRQFVQSVSDYAIYMLDPDGRITNWNSGAEKIKGYRREEIIGQHFSLFYTAEDRATGEPRKGLEIARTEGRFEKEGWRVRKDGSRFWANVVINPVRDEAGAHVGFAKVTRDVTERRQAQHALDEARETLFQAQKMEAVGCLTSGIANDFNNLLMAMLGSLELARERLSPADPASAGIRSLLDNAVRSAERGASLTRRMLAFARRQELHPESVDLITLETTMRRRLERALGPSIALAIDFPADLDPVLIDARALEDALATLAANARDAMPEGGTASLFARAHDVRHDPTGHPLGRRFVCLSFGDTGEGMDEATLARATEPFFTTKEVGKGTGMGLSMVHGLAQQSGGWLALRSRRGLGTTAEIWLPVAARPRDAQRPLAERPACVREGASKTILVVDDDGPVLTNTAAMLRDAGHVVIEARSGAEALALVAAHGAVDLVITDEAMTRMTGTALAAALRAERPGLPIILATGYAKPLSQIGPSLVSLIKPFGENELLCAVAAALREPGSRSPH